MNETLAYTAAALAAAAATWPLARRRLELSLSFSNFPPLERPAVAAAADTARAH